MIKFFHKMQNLLFLLICTITVNSETLLSVSDDELLQLIKDKEKLIILFTKRDCLTCEKFEEVVDNLHKDFKKHLNAEIAKASNSHLARLYSPSKEPALVFFRHGIPLLYNDEPNENEIFDFFEKNQSPAVKELTDKIFEHMTQAATGATTGDWFVMFYGASCVECQRLHAVWEGVGATLRGRVNVARVDANLAGVNTAKRFKVTNLPAFIFFHHGKFYKYELPKKDIKSFASFARDWYKNAKGDTVPLLSSPFDELVDWCIELIKTSIAFGLEILEKHPWMWQVGIAVVAGFGLVALTALIAIMKAGKSKTSKEVKKEKKSK